MTGFFSHRIEPGRMVTAIMSRRCRYLLVVWIALVWGMMGAGIPQHLVAQPDPGQVPGEAIDPGPVVVIPPVGNPDYCDDACCRTEVLLLNTGYNHAAGGVYPVGSNDDYWTIVADQDPTRSVPRPANVISAGAVWSGAMNNTQWIGPNPGADDRFIGQVTYEKCFCICGPENSVLTFALDILVDDSASVYVDGAYQGSTPNLSFVTPASVDFTMVLGPGRHCIDVVVNNNYVVLSGLDIQGTIQGNGLVKYTCCGPVIPPDPCVTDSLTLATGDRGWEIVQGPDYNGPYPRCADVIDPPYHGWGLPIDGTTWIGPNPTGENKPDEVYVYRKCFCTKEEGWFTMDFTTMADEQADVSVNGVYIFSVPNPGWHAPVRNSARVLLKAGCNCIEYKVSDPGGLVTGLDALIEISGGLLLRPECCECDRCHGIEGKAKGSPDMGGLRHTGEDLRSQR